MCSTSMDTLSPISAHGKAIPHGKPCPHVENGLIRNKNSRPTKYLNLGFIISLASFAISDGIHAHLVTRFRPFPPMENSLPLTTNPFYTRKSGISVTTRQLFSYFHCIWLRCGYKLPVPTIRYGTECSLSSDVKISWFFCPALFHEIFLKY